MLSFIYFKSVSKTGNLWPHKYGANSPWPLSAAIEHRHRRWAGPDPWDWFMLLNAESECTLPKCLLKHHNKKHHQYECFKRYQGAAQTNAINKARDLCRYLLSPCWKFNQGILCTYKQGADISHCEMRFGFYQDSGIFVKKIKNREKSLLVWYSVVFMGREFKKHRKNRETSENSCNCQKHLKRSVRYSSCFHYKGIVVLQKASEMYLAS